MKIDPVYIRKAVKDGELEFYIERGVIYCKPLPENGERFIVGQSDTCNITKLPCSGCQPCCGSRR